MTAAGTNDGVAARLTLPDGEAVVLSRSDAPMKPGVLHRLRRDGSTAWTAEPRDEDYFVSLDEAAGALVAATWNGLFYRLDPRDGRVLAIDFVK